jgi:phosphonopyruvate decarboxylase
MGHCSSIALGIAMSKPKSQVVCIDGDGAAIMHLGAMVTFGQRALPNCKHILINNAVHDSVGGQPTGGTAVDFSAVALGCGYKAAEMVSRAEDVRPALERLRNTEGPCFLEVRALPGARADLGRPTTSTAENRAAFMQMLERC